MAGGTAVELPAGSPLAGQEWLAVAVADRTPGAEHGRIRLAAAADRELAELAAPALLVEADEVRWADGDVVARRVRRLGAIVLAERRLDDPDPDAVAAALRDGLRPEGLGLLRWSERARRCATGWPSCTAPSATPWPDVSDAALLADPDRWWGPAAGPRPQPRRPRPDRRRRRAARAARPPARPPGWTSSRRSGSRCPPAPGSRWTTPPTSRCSR